MVRQHMPSAAAAANRHRPMNQLPPQRNMDQLDDQQHRPNRNQIIEEANRRLQEERNRPINRENIDLNAGGPASGNLNRINVEDEAVSRLKRNLQLKSREEDHFLPKRFDEPLLHDRLAMAAFSVNDSNQLSASQPRERRLELLRRMEEKILAMRRAREQQIEDIPPSPKRIKRNCIGVFACDISSLLDDEPTLDWIEYKNAGIIQGAPERLILSSLVTGNGELIMFGGLRKESLSNSTAPMQVSNSLHFLTFPRGVI